MNQKARHALRIVVGLYLAYLGWQLFDAVVIKGTGKVLLGAVLGPVFIIVGLLYAINSIRKMLAIRKEEQYGTADSQENDITEHGGEENKADEDAHARLAEDNSIDATLEDTASEDTASEDAASEDAASEDTASEDAASEDAASEDAASEDTASEDAASEDVNAEDIEKER